MNQVPKVRVAIIEELEFIALGNLQLLELSNQIPYKSWSLDHVLALDTVLVLESIKTSTSLFTEMNSSHSGVEYLHPSLLT